MAAVMNVAIIWDTAPCSLDYAALYPRRWQLCLLPCLHTSLFNSFRKYCYVVYVLLLPYTARRNESREGQRKEIHKWIFHFRKRWWKTNFFREKQLGLILGSEVNSHHSMWGSSDINLRGIALLGTYVLSQGDKPTFLTERWQGTINLTLRSRQPVKEIYGVV
jgi:hypothetical protein